MVSKKPCGEKHVVWGCTRYGRSMTSRTDPPDRTLTMASRNDRGDVPGWPVVDLGTPQVCCRLRHSDDIGRDASAVALAETWVTRKNPLSMRM